MDAPLQRRAANWSRYWAAGAAHSCVGSFGPTYGGQIAAWWDANFRSLDRSCRVLDIGTGSGALPRRITECANGDLERFPHIIAVDLAAIDFNWIPDPAPSWAGRIDLHGGVCAESLPIADRSIDLACSQFGIEYANPRAAVNEVLRVLRPNGRAALVMHAAHSLLVTVAEEEAEHLRWLLIEDGWVGAVTAMLRPMAISGTPQGLSRLAGDGHAVLLRQRYNAMLRQLQARAEQARVPDALLEARDVAAALFAVAVRQGEVAASAVMQEWIAASADALERQRELVAAALDRNRLESFIAPFISAGRIVEVGELQHDDSRSLAWGVAVGPASD